MDRESWWRAHVSTVEAKRDADGRHLGQVCESEHFMGIFFISIFIFFSRVGKFNL